MAGLAVDGHNLEQIGLAVGDEAEIRHLEVEVDDTILITVVFADVAHEVVDAFLQRRQ